METKYQKDPNDIGCLWKKQSAKGMEFMSGSIEINGEKINIVIFSQQKKSEKAPDYKILISKPREEGVIQAKDLPF